jgi:hypothetical protein
VSAIDQTQAAFLAMLQSMSSAPTIALAATPLIVALLQENNREIAALRAELAKKSSVPSELDGWLDAKAAAKYLGISSGSFDKYRYKTSPKIKGYALDGKTLYKRSDLDSFVMLYELKSSGLA